MAPHEAEPRKRNSSKPETKFIDYEVIETALQLDAENIGIPENSESIGIPKDLKKELRLNNLKWSEITRKTSLLFVGKKTKGFFKNETSAVIVLTQDDKNENIYRLRITGLNTKNELVRYQSSAIDKI